MPYDYNSTSSLAHARNFKYIKREPDGKGGWRYYYDVKKHGADIKKRVENKTGITAKNRLDKADNAKLRAKWDHDSAKSKTANAKSDYERTVSYRQYLQNKKGFNASDGREYVRTREKEDEYKQKYDEAVKNEKKAKQKHRATSKEYETAKKEYESVPLVKLSKETKKVIEKGCSKVDSWLEAASNNIDEAKKKIDEVNKKIDSKVEPISGKRHAEAIEDAKNRLIDAQIDRNNAYDEDAKNKAEINFQKAKKDYETTKEKYYKDTTRGKIEDKLGADELERVKNAYYKKTEAEFDKDIAAINYEGNKNSQLTTKDYKNELRTATQKHDEALTEFNKAKDEYLNTPIGKLDKASGHFKDDGRQFLTEYFNTYLPYKNVIGRSDNGIFHR